MRPLTIPVAPESEAQEAEVAGRWAKGNYDDIDPDDIASH